MDWLRVFGISVAVFIITALAMSAMASPSKTWIVCLGQECRSYPEKKLALDFAAKNLREVTSVVEQKELLVKARVSFTSKESK